MKSIEVFVADSDASMLIRINDDTIELTAEEAAYLMSMMARADKSFHFVDSETDGRGRPLTRITPVHGDFK